MTEPRAIVGLAVLAGALAAAGIRASGAPDDRDDIGATPLIRAAAFSTSARVRELLDAGADPNLTTNGGATALMWATGDATKVRLLLDHRAAVNAATMDGDTALVTAARRGNVESIATLARARRRSEVLPKAHGRTVEARVQRSSRDASTPE